MAGEPADCAARFRRLIAATGPISLAQYMAESNAHYYAYRDPLGAGGDFTTAPEISQMFGELIGLWLADSWHRAGAPERVNYVELGPGRGTLARDALRTMGQAMARAGLAPQVHLVEASPVLREQQSALVPGAHFHEDLGTVPEDAPILLVANEFLDALPVRQLVRTAAGWREVMVGLADGELVPMAGAVPMDAAIPTMWREAPEQTIIETSPASAAIVGEVARRLAAQGGAALFVDYGHTQPRTGSTLQAVRGHAKVEALACPGEADLSAHVDFAALADVAVRAGCRLLSTIEQGRWLTGLGIDQRLATLAAAVPDQAEALRIARDRLVEPAQMGELFKVMALAGPDWAIPAPTGQA